MMTLEDLFPEEIKQVVKTPTILELTKSLVNLEGGNLHTIETNLTTSYNPLIRELYNVDSDGDVMMVSPNIYNGMSSKHTKNTLMFNESHGDIVLSHTHETMYAIIRLSKFINDKYAKDTTNTLKTNPRNLNKTDKITIDEIIDKPHEWVIYEGKEMPLLYAIMNKLSNIWIDYDEIPLITKTSLTEFYYKNVYSEYIWDTVWQWNMLFDVLSTTISDCGLQFTLKDFQFPKAIEYTVRNEVVLGFVHQNIYIDKCLKELSESGSIFAKMIDANVGIKPANLSSAFSSGFSTLFDGSTVNSNATKGLIHGLSEVEYAITSSGARKGLRLKEQGIPIAGGLLRTTYNNYGMVIHDEHNHDCGTRRTRDVFINENNYKNYHGSNYVTENGDIKRFDVDKNVELNKVYNFRSPLYCKAKNFSVCRTCWHEPDKNEFIKYIGLESASKVIEIIIQSMLGSHHSSGAFYIKTDSRFRELVEKHIPYEIENNVITFLNPIDEKTLEEFLTLWKNHYNDDGDIVFNVISTERVEFIVMNNPIADDASKNLSLMKKLIDKNVNIDDEDWLTPEQTVDKLIEITQSKRYYKFFELLVSSLYFDEDGYLSRESGKDPIMKIALTAIIKTIDPFNEMMTGYSKTAYTNAQLDSLGIPPLKKDRDQNISRPKPYINKNINHAYDNIVRFTTYEGIEYE